jgi:hypothetical protein
MASARTVLALEVLQAGGFFRTALERAWNGGEKFKTRLRTAKGNVVPGIGPAQFRKLESAGLLVQRECAKSSTWPTEFVLREAPPVTL